MPAFERPSRLSAQRTVHDIYARQRQFVNYEERGCQGRGDRPSFV